MAILKPKPSGWSENEGLFDRLSRQVTIQGYQQSLSSLEPPQNYPTLLGSSEKQSKSFNEKL